MAHSQTLLQDLTLALQSNKINPQLLREILQAFESVTCIKDIFIPDLFPKKGKVGYYDVYFEYKDKIWKATVDFRLMKDEYGDIGDIRILRLPNNSLFNQQLLSKLN